MPIVTVRDLIEHLSKFPPDAPVVQPLGSEVGDLDLECVKLIPGSENKLIRWGGIVSGMRETRADYVTFHPSYMPEGFVPEFIDAVHFPGN